MNKRFLAFGMAAVSALSAITPALAVEQHSGDENKVPVELTVEKPTFSVTVPTGLPVAVDAAGKVYCSTNATIKNNTFGQVKVSNVTIEGNQPWTVADWATDMQKEKVNTTKIAMQLNQGVTDASGYQFAPENFPVMDGHGSLPLTYDAKLPAQTKVISGDTVANVVFTVGWNTEKDPSGYEITPNKDLADIIDENGIAQVEVGDSIRLEAVATYAEGQTFWESNQSSIVQITEDAEDHCIAKVVGPGSATITYTKNGVKGEIQFVSKAPLKSIFLDHESLTLNKGSEADLHVIYNPSNTTDSKTVQWSIDHGDIVSVENGHLIAKNWGVATITATVGGKHTASCVVTVPKILNGVTLSEHDITMENGAQHKLTATAKYREAPVWSVIEGNCVTVNNGNITATAPGTAKIQVQVGGFKDVCTVHVTQKLNSISLSQNTLTLKNGSTVQLNVNYNPSNTTEDKFVKWSSSPSGIVSIVNGKVTATNAGKATITARVGNKTANCTVTVKPAPINPPHATGSPIDKDMFINNLNYLSGNITFSREPAPSSRTIPLNNDNTVVAVINNYTDATIYSKNGGGVFAPVDASYLFSYFGDESFMVSSVDLSGLDTSKTINMQGMFDITNSLTNIYGLDNFDTSNVTNMSYMFENNASKTLDLSSFDTSKVTHMGGMFLGSKATTINGLSNFDTSKVTNMSFMFYSAIAPMLNIPNFDTSNVTDMVGMFEASAATTLDLSGFTIQPSCKVKDEYGVMFGDKTALKTLYYKDAAALAKMQEGHLSPSVTTIQGPAPKS